MKIEVVKLEDWVQPLGELLTNVLDFDGAKVGVVVPYGFLDIDLYIKHGKYNSMRRQLTTVNNAVVDFVYGTQDFKELLNKMCGRQWTHLVCVNTDEQTTKYAVSRIRPFSNQQREMFYLDTTGKFCGLDTLIGHHSKLCLTIS